MGRVAIQPVHSHEGPRKRAEILAAESIDERFTTTGSSIYIIQPVTKLPTINLTRTVAGTLAGRRQAQSMDAFIIQLATNYETLWHLVGILFMLACAELVILRDSTAKYLVTATSILPMVPMVWICMSSLCWDMLILLTQTFEFWFLIFINVLDTILWSFMFNDVRIVMSIVATASCLLTVFLDANLHMRALTVRLFVPGSLGLLFITAAFNMRFARDVVYPSVNLWGAEMRAVDVINSGTSTVAFFMLTRVYRHRSLLFARREESSGPAMIQCDIYFPVCRLVQYEEWTQKRRTTVSQATHHYRRHAEATQLELVERDQLRIVDARDTIISPLWCHFGSRFNTCSFVSRLLRWILNTIGVGGLMLVIYLSGRAVVDAQRTQVGHKQQSGHERWHITACALTSCFVFAHAAFFQRELFRRICVEIDAWFVSFQASVVAIGMCDVFRWDERGLLVGAAWIWCHWLLFLDALPPSMRTRLALTRVFIVSVCIMLLAFPLWLGYMMHYAPNTKVANQNRVIFEGAVGQFEIRMEMFSFLLSRIFTLWVWMGRFFWREVLRPRDSFKFIKYRVHFPQC